MHLGQLSTNDSYSPWVSEHDGENRIELLSVVFKFPLREGGQVLAKIDVDTLKKRNMTAKMARMVRIQSEPASYEVKLRQRFHRNRKGFKT